MPNICPTSFQKCLQCHFLPHSKVFRIKTKISSLWQAMICHSSINQFYQSEKYEFSDIESKTGSSVFILRLLLAFITPCRITGKIDFFWVVRNYIEKNSHY